MESLGLGFAAGFSRWGLSYFWMLQSIICHKHGMNKSSSSTNFSFTCCHGLCLEIIQSCFAAGKLWLAASNACATIACAQIALHGEVLYGSGRRGALGLARKVEPVTHGRTIWPIALVA
jgi:hypothetical protein